MTETTQQDSPISEVHLAEPNMRPFNNLYAYRSLAGSILSTLTHARVEGQVLSEDPYSQRLLSTLRGLVTSCAHGLLVEDSRINAMTPLSIRRAKEFKDITGLDDESAKNWATRASGVLTEAMGNNALSEEAAAFLVSDIEPFAERLIMQPIFIRR